MNKGNYSSDLPNPPPLLKALGPSFILVGLALGSGEIIMWPYLVARFGLGIFWGALLGITFQFILNTEIMRYTLAWGESIFVGFRKISRYLPFWFIISTFIPWGMPGFSSASAQIIANLFNYSYFVHISIILLIFAGILLTGGKTLYKTMEKWQKIVVILSVSFFLFLALLLIKTEHLNELLLGLVGKGNNFNWLPPTISLSAFLGALAYSGAGGNLNFAQSYYIKEKGMGMGKYAAKISSLFNKESQVASLDGQLFLQNKQNTQRWKNWWRLVNLEHGIVFWLLGFVSMALLALLAKVLVQDGTNFEGLGFLFLESQKLSQLLSPLFSKFFLVTVALALFSTQVIVLESSSRMISENVLLIKFKKGSRFNASKAFYLALWLQITLGIIILSFGISEPRILLTAAAVLNAIAMTFAFPLVYLLNFLKLPPKIRPGVIKSLLFFIAFVFFVFFSLLTLVSKLGF